MVLAGNKTNPLSLVNHTTKQFIIPMTKKYISSPAKVETSKIPYIYVGVLEFTHLKKTTIKWTSKLNLITLRIGHFRHFRC